MSHPYGGRSHYSVVIVGGGQAGLSLSYCLQLRGIDHLVIEKRSLVHTWRTQRWDSFCLVTPNWQCQLPGWGYKGGDPHGFMVKDQINEWLAGFVEHVKAPAIEGVTVERVARDGERERFNVQTDVGLYTADQVVVASGGYHRPIVPRLAEKLPAGVAQFHSAQYRNPAFTGDATFITGQVVDTAIHRRRSHRVTVAVEMTNQDDAVLAKAKVEVELPSETAPPVR